MSASPVRVSREWLGLREPADAAARSRDLVRMLTPPRGGWVIHDLGAGSGAMGRWLAPLLRGRQQWVLHDRDPDLLRAAAANPPMGADVAVHTRRSDITRLDTEDLAGATLITASALLDMLTADESAALITACADVRCPVLMTLSVVGRVRLDPPEPLDARLASAFNDHQRRTTPRGRLLGPDAVAAAVAEFRRYGAEPIVRPSPWRLGPEQRDLAAEWLRGWVGAACEQEAQLSDEATVYARRRLAQAAAGTLSVTVEHADLLVLPHSVSKRGDSA